MKGYVGTILQLPESVKMAERCVESGKQFGIDITIFPAVYKTVSINEMKKEGLTLAHFDTTYSNINAVVGNFITQFRIWKLIANSDEPGIVLEHDAVVIQPLPELADKGNIINLGKPSYGNFRSQAIPGVYPMFSKPGGYIPGAHGYYITPKGARQLIDKAKTLGVSPCDIFLNNKNFPNIKETFPWYIEAHDEFTTIQVQKGCLAKHNYNNNYKIL